MVAELHDYMGPHGRSVGMPLNEFINETWIGLEEVRILLRFARLIVTDCDKRVGTKLSSTVE